MSFNPPEGILDIGNATLRVGKLEVAETTGLNQGLQNIVKNDLLITEKETYLTNKTWGIKLPTAWVGEFDLKTHDNKYVEFNFYNEGSTSNALGYTLNFKDTTLTLKYDNGNTLVSETIPDVSTSTYKKVNVFFERGVIAVFIDGARVLYFKESDTYNSVHGHPGMASRVASTTGGSFVNIFIEADGSDSAVKDLRIVNGRFISDKTSNVSFIGSLGVGVNSPQEALDIRGNMHFNRVSNVSQVSVDSNVVTEYTGPHDRPLRKYPEVALSITSESASGENGYKVSWSSIYDNGNNVNERPFRAFDGDIGNTGNAWMVPSGVYGSDGTYAQNPPRNLGTATGGNSTTVDGEYIILQTPNKIKVKYFRISDKSTFTNRAAEAGKLYGSNDGSTWYELTSFSELTYHDGNYFNTVHVNATTYYDRLALVVTNSTATSSTYMGIGELEYYGYEEGSGSLDTTLKSVYNVPATTGTQLEVYYDAKDLVDMPNIVTDLSPNTNGGSVTGVTLDETGGIDSFKFATSSSQYIEKVFSGYTQSTEYSASVWFKSDSYTADSYIFQLGLGDHSNGSGIGMNIESEGPLRAYIYGYGSSSQVSTSVDSIATGTWYHATATYYSSGKIELYINGVLVGEGKATQLGTINAAAPLTLGTYYVNSTRQTPSFNGSIANFRLYSKALNADQVKELYHYQKDYFLGSKSQLTLYKGHLGVGVTEPSGQLELAGDERIQEYPPGPMSDYDTHIPGHGVFKVYVSGIHQQTTNYPGWKAFNDNPDGELDAWITYDPSYNNGVHTLNKRLSSNTPVGEYIILQFPYKVKISLAKLHERANDTDNAPSGGVFYGSNDGVSWTELKSFSGLTYNNTAGVYSDVEINATEYFDKIALVVTNIDDNTNTWMGLGELRYFGTPGPTTLDKGSLTLGRSLDVPRVSRYDVDTETPRPEKLVVDYDTNIPPFNNQFIEDKSGRGNDGTFYNGASYSAADKAFVFDGSDDYIKGSRPASLTGNVSYTIALWVKFDTTPANNYNGIVEIGDRATNSTLGTFPSIFVYHGANLGFYFSNGDGIVTSGVLPVAGRWYHLVAVYDQGNNKGHFYIDGGTTFTGSGTPVSTTNFLSSASVFLGGDSSANSGQYLDGQISNFKLYSVALEPSEIKKLYRLGRTGRSMILADTSLQIGAGLHDSINTTGGPRAHLDVHGSILASSTIHGMSGNFHKMLGYGRGGGQADHHRADNCLTAMGGMTTASGSSYASVGFIIRKSSGYMPFVVEVYHSGVNSDSQSLFGRRAVLYGSINNTTITPSNGIGQVNGVANGDVNDGIVLSASARGDDHVLFDISANREGRSYGTMMCRLCYYYGIKGREY